MEDKRKFRGMNKGKWYYGGYFKHLPYTPYCCSGPAPESDYKHLIIMDGFSDWGLPRSMTCIEVDPETVGQCSGLKDKNGNLIYEGDIVRYTCSAEYCSDGLHKCQDCCPSEIATIHFDEVQAMFTYRSESNQCSLTDSICTEEDLEVIGNWHEHKELLND